MKSIRSLLCGVLMISVLSSCVPISERSNSANVIAENRSKNGNRNTVFDVNGLYRPSSNNMNSSNGDMTEQDVDIEALPLLVKLDGGVAKSFIVAYEAFRNQPEIPETKRSLQNYFIKLHKSDDDVYVHFQPKSLDADLTRKGGETSLGKAIVYVIREKDFTIKRFYFFE
ncbi:MAG: hypothetical protein ACRD6X_22270 [Pyrinomonadaceae bacterium]